MVGVILLYQNAANHFESWAYAWGLVFPTATGLGRMIYGLLKGSNLVEAVWKMASGLLECGDGWYPVSEMAVPGHFLRLTEPLL